MRILSIGILIAVSATWPLQAGEQESIEVMVTKLGSKSYKEREAATQWLIERPDTAPALRKALHSSVPEVARRAALILDHFDRQPLRRLNAAIKDGAVRQVIELLAEWPKGKHEEGVWAAALDLGSRMLDLHHKQKGTKIDLPLLTDRGGPKPPILLSGERVTGTIKNRETGLFIRAGVVTLDKTYELNDSVIVASGPVSIRSEYSSGIILADGPIELDGVINAIVVSSGDVTVSKILHNAVIIARGKVICRTPISDCRIISGKSVLYNKKNARNAQVTENEANPLGFVRFSDPAPPDGKLGPAEEDVRDKKKD